MKNLVTFIHKGDVEWNLVLCDFTKVSDVWQV